MHMNKTKRLKYQRLIKNYKNKKEITTAVNNMVKIVNTYLLNKHVPKNLEEIINFLIK